MSKPVTQQFQMSDIGSRLLLVSSRARNKPAIYGSLKPHIKTVEYNFDSHSMDDIYGIIAKFLVGQRVASMAIVLHSSEKELFLCAAGEARLSLRTIISDDHVRQFMVRIVTDFIDLENWSSRLDFLATYMAEQINGGLLAKELETLLGCQVGMSKNLEGSDIQMIKRAPGGGFATVGDMYFDLPTLQNKLSQVGRVTKDGERKLENYEKLRIVGKGAFGHAVLYRRKTDGLLVIIKEINMLDLAASDRQMALNEVKVLATMDHPSIIAYHDSFEKDGVLMIEMEFADGGNLADFLIKRKSTKPFFLEIDYSQPIQLFHSPICNSRPIEERDILDVFEQMVSAIRYMHAKNVLHRDLKTANIFLTKEGIVKIGDFGISKLLTSTKGGAHTVLGTPYYISPEMCEGKVYDEKSDIWALGCILYEMACLQKTFEGSNLPALVNKIMRGQFAPIRGNYSYLFKQLVRDLLQRDPEFRPSASEVLFSKLPELQAQFEESRYYDDPEDLEEVMADNSNNKTRQSRPPRSVLYYLKGYESSISLTPISLPPRCRVLQVAVSNTHIVALTSDLVVFTWGEGRKGQLGHGEIESWRSRPFPVESLKAKSITRVGAGDGFSVFSSDSGILMTCGDGSFGALGHGDWQSSGMPKLVETLLTIDVAAVACGPEHVVVVGGKGDVYAWGRGKNGRLGLGHEEDCCTPQEVKINTEEVFIVNAKCGGNATMLLADNGSIYACGGNRYNRLGVDETRGLIMTKHIDQLLVPTKVKSIKMAIVEIAMSATHSVCLTDSGKVITFGRNSEAQLGRGHSRNSFQPDYVKALIDKEVTMVSCGATFTVVGTNENVLYFWGTRFISPITRPNTRDAFSQSFGARIATPYEGSLSDAEVREMIHKEMRRRGKDRDSLSASHADDRDDKTLETLSSSDLLTYQGEITMKDDYEDEHDNNAVTQVPDWLKNEIDEAEDVRRPPSTRKKVPPRTPSGRKRPSVAMEHQNASLDEYKRKLDVEYRRKQEEMRMEAQNAVQLREKAWNEKVVALRDELERQKLRQNENLAKKEKNAASGSTTCLIQ
eukprot:TCALIF_04774-PA protein Name:"Similar to nek8 Serine/threonine-protein kinase Nek8 (Danio rerio)" AED:0.11 eAED:0.12 QI:30/0.66/0.28/0.85/0.83/0.71/7/0/1060